MSTILSYRKLLVRTYEVEKMTIEKLRALVISINEMKIMMIETEVQYWNLSSRALIERVPFEAFYGVRRKHW